MSRRRERLENNAQLDAETVINTIHDYPDGTSVRELADIFNLNRAEQKQLTRLLNTLQGTGIIKRYGNEFRWADSNRVFIGTLRQRRRKNISFIPDDEHERIRGRIRVLTDDTNGAFRF